MQKRLGYIAGAVLLLAGIYGVLMYVPHKSMEQGQQPAPSVQTLFGLVTAVSPSSVTVDVQSPALGATVVAISNTTRITKETPLSPEELQAAFKEFQEKQAAANGEAFAAPAASASTVLALSDLQAGDTVLITLTADSAKDAFAAAKIEVLPAQPASAGAGPAGMTPAPTPTPAPAPAIGDM